MILMTNKPKRKCNIPEKYYWKPGISPYKVFLDKLTPDERAAHLEKRKQKRDMKAAMKAIIMHNQIEWLTNLNTAASVLTAKAISEGDVQAFTAVWDRVIGKPDEDIKVSKQMPLPFDDDFDE